MHERHGQESRFSHILQLSTGAGGAFAVDTDNTGSILARRQVSPNSLPRRAQGKGSPAPSTATAPSSWPTGIHPLTLPRLADLLRAAQPYPEAQRYLALCAFAGIRPTEATRLTYSDLSPDEPIISVRAKSSKTGGARHITIRPVLAAWLAHTAPAKPPAPGVPAAPCRRGGALILTD